MDAGVQSLLDRAESSRLNLRRPGRFLIWARPLPVVADGPRCVASPPRGEA